jgi:tetratricopeptide (TPR) repeat protein
MPKASPQTLFDFSDVADTKICLYISNPVLRRFTSITLDQLGFTNVVDFDVSSNYFEAIKRLASIIGSDSEIVLCSIPEKTPGSDRNNDLETIFERVQNVYLDLKAHLSARNNDPLKLLSKTIPVIEVGDYLRDKLVEVLFKFRVPAAFFMSKAEPVNHLKGRLKEKIIRENFTNHYRELSKYLAQYFRDRDQLVALADEQLSEKKLSERKKQYEDLLARAQYCKETGDFDRSIAILRQAIDIFPDDIEAYLESGRLYVRKREYGRALVRYGQAEDLFQDAPAPNKEIASVRFIQAKEKIEAGADPESPEIMALLKEAADQCRLAHKKNQDMMSKISQVPEAEQSIDISQEILKWNPAEFLGATHPVVQDLHALVEETTKGLEKIPHEKLSARQCVSLGLMALNRGDIALAEDYYFKGLEDRVHFSEVCTEINFMGIRLRNQGQIGDALRIYKRLLQHTPHNQGAVCWNMALAHMRINQILHAAGCAARALYADPFLAREPELYCTFNQQFVSILLKMVNTISAAHAAFGSTQPNPQLVKLYQVRDRMFELIEKNKKTDALKIFLTLQKKAPNFIVKSEFHADGLVPNFLKNVYTSLASDQTPSKKALAESIASFLKIIMAAQPTTETANFMKLLRSANLAIIRRSDRHLAAYHLGQAILVAPKSYFEGPDFQAMANLPGLLKELVGKFRYLDIARFPQAPNDEDKITPLTANPENAKASSSHTPAGW